MELERGRVVRSAAGRDKGSFLVVWEVLPGHILVCDGKDRPLNRPKRKNPRHLALTSTVLPEEAMKTNRQIRAALRAFRDGAGKT